jgi:hypothetical protein
VDTTHLVEMLNDLCNEAQRLYPLWDNRPALLREFTLQLQNAENDQQQLEALQTLENFIRGGQRALYDISFSPPHGSSKIHKEIGEDFAETLKITYQEILRFLPPPSDIEITVKNQIQARAYVAALESLIDINHPIVPELFPRKRNTFKPNPHIAWHLSSKEIADLKKFIYQQRFSLFVKSLTLIVGSSYPLVMLINSILQLWRYGKAALLESSLWCFIGPIALAIFVFCLVMLWRTLTSETYAII